MENKKAQGMSVTTIILIILGLVVLVVLILGFTMGWANLREYIAPSNNVASIVQQCSIACNTDQQYNYCTEVRTLKSSDLPNGEKEMAGNCSYFATNTDYTNYGVGACPGLCA